MLQILVHSTWLGTEITSCGTVGVLDVHTDIKWMPLDMTATPPLHRCSKQGVHSGFRLSINCNHFSRPFQGLFKDHLLGI